jgi:hypothetical protein
VPVMPWRAGLIILAIGVGLAGGMIYRQKNQLGDGARASNEVTAEQSLWTTDPESWLDRMRTIKPEFLVCSSQNASLLLDNMPILMRAAASKDIPIAVRIRVMSVGHLLHVAHESQAPGYPLNDQQGSRKKIDALVLLSARTLYD